jgi:ribosomal protein L19E
MIVGKFVKVSAMQAVVMSRARARTTTARSSNSSGRSTKHGTGSNNPGTRVMQQVTWRACQNKKRSKFEIKEANDILKHLPSSLVKEYTSIHAFVNEMSFKSFLTVHLFHC